MYCPPTLSSNALQIGRWESSPLNLRNLCVTQPMPSQVQPLPGLSWTQGHRGRRRHQRPEVQSNRFLSSLYRKRMAGNHDRHNGTPALMSPSQNGGCETQRKNSHDRNKSALHALRARSLMQVRNVFYAPESRLNDNMKVTPEAMKLIGAEDPHRGPNQRS
jgi:hypothetical protein